MGLGSMNRRNSRRKTTAVKTLAARATWPGAVKPATVTGLGDHMVRSPEDALCERLSTRRDGKLDGSVLPRCAGAHQHFIHADHHPCVKVAQVRLSWLNGKSAVFSGYMIDTSLAFLDLQQNRAPGFQTQS
ncbi:hypothetical protein HYQ46_005826 [Verticillium longisporum]|nr:hypothetical protein HYQ46_005826 [Verticillium longisporum]